MPRRRFLPPAVCTKCQQPPVLGDTLINTGENVWLCSACITEQAEGSDLAAKQAIESLRYEHERTTAKRMRAAGSIELAAEYEADASWHGSQAVAIRRHGNRLAQTTPVIQGEALPKSGYLRDTLSDPDLVSVESSYTRGRLLQSNDAVALGVDVANTAGADNTHEKLLAHQIAVAHKVALEQTAAAERTSDPLVETKRLQIAARMMQTAQQAMLTLQKLKTGTNHTVVVQHVTVSGHGQAVIGNVAQQGKVKRYSTT
jgi:hypothetical protein